MGVFGAKNKLNHPKVTIRYGNYYTSEPLTNEIKDFCTEKKIKKIY